jgi:gamma-glutamyltranspeptidase/glutathione hydrolase
MTNNGFGALRRSIFALLKKRGKGRFHDDAVSLRSRGFASIFIIALLVPVPGYASPVVGAQGPITGAAIASAHPLATRAGYEILKRGGNAFDAGVAVSAALGVVEPYSSGLGGGGFWLLHRAADGSDVMVDSRETAPGRATPDMYLDAHGRPIPHASTRGGKAAGIPGVPAALVHIAQHYGRLPLATDLEPAIRLARDGFAVDKRFAHMTQLREKLLQNGRNTAATFLDHGHALKPGFLLKQPDLARTLEALAQHGRAGFYEGSVAAHLAHAIDAAGGIWSLDDLRDYRVIERKPARIHYRGATVIAASLPSAGGIALAQTLHMLERYDLPDTRSARSTHFIVEALRRAFQDRARYLGDPGFVKVPVARLVSRPYADERAASIDADRATPSSALALHPAPLHEGDNTSHFSIIDQDGNCVAATLSINLLFGSGVVGDDTGVLLNDEMDDFTTAPGVPNSFKLRGGEPDRVEPGKRPLSSMTPTFVEDHKGIFVVGSPGGSRIISQVLLAVLDYIQQPSVDLQRIVGAPRYHHQFWPDVVEIEPDSFSKQWQAAMEHYGYHLKIIGRKWGNMQAAFKSRVDGTAIAASDPRGEGIAWY